MVMGRKRKHSESTDVVAPSGDKSPSADCSDRSTSKGTAAAAAAADTSAPGSNDVNVCSSLQDQDQEGGAGGQGTEKVPLQRNAANERERARMRVLSKAFARLKTSLPWVPADTKLSKLDTLRLASCYIAHLSQLLAEDSEDQQTTSSPVHGGVGGGGGGGGGGGNNSVTITSSTTAAITSTNIHPLNLTWPFTFSSRNSSSMGAISSSSSSSVENNRTASRSNTNHPTKYPAAVPDKVEASSA